MEVFTLKRLLLLLSVTFCSNILFAQSDIENDRKLCSDLMKEGRDAIDNNDYVEALEKNTKAEIVAEKYGWIKELTFLKIQIGRSYAGLSNYGEAMSYYMEALSIIKKNKGFENSAVSAMNNIGSLYQAKKEYRSALMYYEPAYSAVKKNNIENLILPLAINVADAFNKLGDYKDAQRYLNEVRYLPKDEIYDHIWKINYAESLMLEGKVIEARNILKKVLPKIDTIKNIDSYVETVRLLSKISDKQNNTKSAIAFAKDGLRKNTQINQRIEIYNQLSELYFKNKDYIKFKIYKDAFVAAKDSASILVNNNLFESNEVKMKVREYQNKIKSNQEKQVVQRIFFTVILILSLVIFFFVYRALHNKIARQNQEKILSQRNQEIINLELENKELELEKQKKDHLLTEQELETVKGLAELQQEQLKNQIAEQNRELSAKALYLSIRNELIEEAISSLSAIPEISKNESVINHIKILNIHLKSDAGWDDFINQFEKINPSFLRTLKEKHPALNAKDIRFICCIYMNLDIKEISNIFNVTYNAANKRKQRIREKMKIYDDATLYNYLLNIGGNF